MQLPVFWFDRLIILSLFLINNANIWNAVTVLCGQLDCDHGTLNCDDGHL